MNNLKIGGRNILLNSSFKENVDKWSVPSSFEIVEFDGKKCGHIQQTELQTIKTARQSVFGKLEPETNYTLSGWIRTNNIVKGTTNCSIMFYHDGFYNNNGTSTWYGYGAKNFPVNNETWEHVVWNFKTDTTKFDNATSSNLYVYTRDFIGDVYFYDLKLEKGDKPTDWTPAIEDVEERMDSAESNISILSNKITSNVTETTSLATRMSTIEQTASGLTIQLSDLEIGGENILVGSREATNVAYGGTSTTVLDNGFTALECINTWAGVGYTVTDLISKASDGDKYTFSVNVKTTGVVKITFFAMCYDSNNQRVYPTYSTGQFNSQYIVTTPENEDDKRYSITIPITQGWIDLVNDGGYIKWTIQLSERTDSDAKLYMYAAKLERGNKATDWSPNPNDFYSRLDSADADIITAQTTANTAVTNAANAAKTATNYMNFSSSGLVIGDMTASTLGENVRITASTVDIRDGTTTLASFGANTIYLGKNSETSVINLCNAAATMRVKDNTDFRIYTDKRLVMSAYSSMLLDCWRDSTHMTRIAIQSSDPDVSSVVGGVQFTIYQGNIQNTVSMLRNNIELKVTDGTNETRFNVDEKIIKAYAAERIRLNSKQPLQVAESSTYSAAILLGNNYTVSKSIACHWSDGETHDMLSNATNGQTTYLGPADIGEATTTSIRGKYVRLYAHEGGGVYLGYSGSTAITSDKNMKKDILDIDDKYIDFFDRLRPITYKYNVGHRDHIGFVAQEVEEALVESGLTTEQFAGLVIEKDVTLNPDYDSSLSDEENTANEEHYDTLYSLRYEEFISLLVKKVQDLQRQVNELKGE